MLLNFILLPFEIITKSFMVHIAIQILQQNPYFMTSTKSIIAANVDFVRIGFHVQNIITALIIFFTSQLEFVFNSELFCCRKLLLHRKIRKWIRTLDLERGFMGFGLCLQIYIWIALYMSYIILSISSFFKSFGEMLSKCYRILLITNILHKIFSHQEYEIP